MRIYVSIFAAFLFLSIGFWPLIQKYFWKPFVKFLVYMFVSKKRMINGFLVDIETETFYLPNSTGPIIYHSNEVQYSVVKILPEKKEDDIVFIEIPPLLLESLKSKLKREGVLMMYFSQLCKKRDWEDCYRLVGEPQLCV